ncbi:glutathione-regulated potassium-efflux system ancillary protein KefG [Vibrio ezurae]|uniref:Glutathione-regulated potassium-efflux system ancillary protein KefG n=1 Tax=Vibrio ezurae NBRC 102218 TaxID=1219080 RepID=U3CR81_9VIBR|nr:glutathione-regulated potassium-efflux system ancillary protein KefG [Vibrio ezurae]GAD80598.1 glutathione-regulated potassium-efflux system ancillary protein KefG [Vibrio ezurae NBRC 102218]
MTKLSAYPSSVPRVLVIYAHPEPDSSVANRCMIDQIKELPNVTVHDLYAEYPDFFIDIALEQQRLLQHDVIVFQHPMFLYSCPALLKEWMDRVLDKGFAFGSHCALQGKHWRSVITTGGQKSAFSPQGYNKYPLEQILQPFELTALLCQMHWIEPMVLYWSRTIPDAECAQHALQYRQWLANPLAEQADVEGGSNGAK